MINTGKRLIVLSTSQTQVLIMAYVSPMSVMPTTEEDSIELIFVILQKFFLMNFFFAAYVG